MLGVYASLPRDYPAHPKDGSSNIVVGMFSSILAPIKFVIGIFAKIGRYFSCNHEKQTLNSLKNKSIEKKSKQKSEKEIIESIVISHLNFSENKFLKFYDKINNLINHLKNQTMNEYILKDTQEILRIIHDKLKPEIINRQINPEEKIILNYLIHDLVNLDAFLFTKNLHNKTTINAEIPVLETLLK